MYVSLTWDNRVLGLSTYGILVILLSSLAQIIYFLSGPFFQLFVITWLYIMKWILCVCTVSLVVGDIALRCGTIRCRSVWDVRVILQTTKKIQWLFKSTIYIFILNFCAM
jgi:hypothetical protein